MRIWTQKEVKTLRATYGRTSVAKLAVQMDRSENAIRVKASKLGLKAPASGHATKPIWMLRLFGWLTRPFRTAQEAGRNHG